VLDLHCVVGDSENLFADKYDLLRTRSKYLNTDGEGGDPSEEPSDVFTPEKKRRDTERTEEILPNQLLSHRQLDPEIQSKFD
jgi:hypothetical protein